MHNTTNAQIKARQVKENERGRVTRERGWNRERKRENEGERERESESESREEREGREKRYRDTRR